MAAADCVVMWLWRQFGSEKIEEKNQAKLRQKYPLKKTVFEPLQQKLSFLTMPKNGFFSKQKTDPSSNAKHHICKKLSFFSLLVLQYCSCCFGLLILTRVFCMVDFLPGLLHSRTTKQHVDGDGKTVLAARVQGNNQPTPSSTQDKFKIPQAFLNSRCLYMKT